MFFSLEKEIILNYNNPQIKIVFLKSLSENTQEKDFLNQDWEEELKAIFKENVLFLPDIKTTKLELFAKLKDKIFEQIFKFLDIEPWKPI